MTDKTRNGLLMNNEEAQLYLLKSIEDFESIREKIIKTRKKLIKKYGWNPDDDLRIVIFEQLDNLIRSFDLSIAFSFRCFHDKKWIHHLLFQNMGLSENIERRETNRIIDRLETFHRVGFIYTLSQVIEGGIRSLLRSINPKDRATDNLSKVCIRLANEMNNPHSLHEVRVALDLFREIRNTIHNNGLYYSLTFSKRREFEYKGKVYIFEDGVLQNNANYNLLSLITADIVLLFEFLVEDKHISRISNMPSPFKESVDNNNL